jgi:hypothetical protein
MNIRFSARARQDFADLPPILKTRVRKQFDLLSGNLRHPSIQAKAEKDLSPFLKPARCHRPSIPVERLPFFIIPGSGPATTRGGAGP